ncbi:hypothetical protein FRB95_001461 [Tulasnella sp. JGI-2019a]|nr:hypothetical protein FRB93_011821 [Tulasnella sp. JGI-2019a]KAG9021787.1 hypothetical protein FRB95_001461 [Tulasnella sp. JGI-2019a]
MHAMHCIFLQQHHIIHSNPDDNHKNSSEDEQMMDAEPNLEHMEHTVHQHHGVSLEEVEDEGDGGQEMASDLTIEVYPEAGTALYEGEAPCQVEFQMQEEAGQQPWEPFASLDKWKLTEWMMKK